MLQSSEFLFVGTLFLENKLSRYLIWTDYHSISKKTWFHNYESFLYHKREISLQVKPIGLGLDCILVCQMWHSIKTCNLWYAPVRHGLISVKLDWWGLCKNSQCEIVSYVEVEKLCKFLKVWDWGLLHVAYINRLLRSMTSFWKNKQLTHSIQKLSA